MKTLKISDQLHAELTSVVGQLIAESQQIRTYQNAVQTLLHQSTRLPTEFLLETEDFLSKNKQFGYTTKEEFLKAGARLLKDCLNYKQIDNSLRNQLKNACPILSEPRNLKGQEPSESNGQKRNTPTIEPEENKTWLN